MFIRKKLLLCAMAVSFCLPYCFFAQTSSLENKTNYVVVEDSIPVESPVSDVESSEPESVTPNLLSDDYDNSDTKKHYFVALGSIFIPNFIIGSWNRYACNQSWAQVSWNDVTHFYDRIQSWDRDWYWTNFVLHPYQGSFSYMGARAANMNMFEAALVSTASSYMWEYFFETNSPSKNDLVYTPIGGFAVGEMLYRLSLEADQLGKFWGYVINPMRLYTEPILGHRPNGPTGNIYEISMKLSLGAAKTHTTFADDSIFSDSELFPVFMAPEFTVIYNDPYGHDSNSPFSQFELTMGGSFGKGSGVGVNSTEQNILYSIDIFSNGMFWSRSPDFGENRDTTIGFVFDYDFMWHSFMEFSSLAPGFAIKQRINYEKSCIEWQLHLDANLLGTADCYYLRRADSDTGSRDYSYNIGGELVAKWRWLSNSGHMLDFDLHAYAMYDFYNQVTEYLDNGWEFIQYLTLNYELPVSKAVRLGLGNNLYMKEALYNDFSDLFSMMYSGSVYTRILYN